MSKIAGDINAEMMKTVSSTQSSVSVSPRSRPTLNYRLVQEIRSLRLQLADRDEQISDLTISSDTYFAERNSARDVWRRASKDRDELRQQLAILDAEVKLLRDALKHIVDGALSLPRFAYKEVQEALAATEPKP